MSLESWFSGSKVVNEEGKPLVVFHGTQSSEHFTVFRTDGHEWVMDDDAEEDFIDEGSGAEPNSFLGAHFTEDKSVASRFASGDIDWLKKRFIGKQVKGEHGRVIPVYLKIKNPAVFNNEQDLDNIIYSQNSNDELIELHLGDLSYDQEVEEEILFAKYSEDPEFRAQVNKDIIATGFFDEPEQRQGMIEFTRDLAHRAKEYLISKGHDGIKYNNDVEGGWAWIAFKPEQIKSAFSKSFTDDPDVTKESLQQKICRYFTESTVVEKYSGELKHLINYINSGIDPADFIYLLADWARHANLEDDWGISDEEIEQLIEDDPYEFLEKLDSDQKDHLVWYIESEPHHDQATLPIYMHVYDAQLVKRDQWLVHFSNDADEIAKDGFTYGAVDPYHAGLTTHFTDEVRKSAPGWNFAFKAGSRDAKFAATKNKYGDKAVIFQSAGIEFHHTGDEESQVMFYGPGVDWVVLIQQDDGTWFIEDNKTGRQLVRQDEYYDIVRWVVENYRQYAKRIINKI